jgi:hypothetical protein
LLIATTIVGCFFAWLNSDYRKQRKAIHAAKRFGFSVYLDYSIEETWATFFRLRPISHVEFGFSEVNSGQAIKGLEALAGINIGVVKLGGDSLYERTVRPAIYTTEFFTLLSKANSIKEIIVSGPVELHQFRPVENLKGLECFSSVGLDGGLTEEGLRFLLGLSQIKRIGLPNGIRDVPESILNERPDVEFFESYWR